MKQFKSSIYLSEQEALLVQEVATKIAKLGGCHAVEAKQLALDKFNSLIDNATAYKINLQPSTCMIINNTLALHCRDVIQDNRRLLIRIFGYKNNIECIKLQDNPVIVQG